MVVVVVVEVVLSACVWPKAASAGGWSGVRQGCEIGRLSKVEHFSEDTNLAISRCCSLVVGRRLGVL